MEESLEMEENQEPKKEDDEREFLPRKAYPAKNVDEMIFSPPPLPRPFGTDDRVFPNHWKENWD